MKDIVFLWQEINVYQFIYLDITVLGFPVFHNKTLVSNYKDNYFKID